MQKDIYNEWLRRLESGTITQSKGRLRDGCCRCCLGVLGDVIQDLCPTIGRWDLDERFGSEPGLSAKDLLPVPVTNDPRIVMTREFTRILAGLNDGGENFHYIAKFIRDQGIVVPEETDFAMRALVWELLDNAHDNKYAVKDAKAETQQLLDYASDLEGKTEAEVLPHVQSWMDFKPRA